MQEVSEGSLGKRRYLFDKIIRQRLVRFAVVHMHLTDGSPLQCNGVEFGLGELATVFAVHESEQPGPTRGVVEVPLALGASSSSSSSAAAAVGASSSSTSSSSAERTTVSLSLASRGLSRRMTSFTIVLKADKIEDTGSVANTTDRAWIAGSCSVAVLRARMRRVFECSVANVISPDLLFWGTDLG